MRRRPLFALLATTAIVMFLTTQVASAAILTWDANGSAEPNPLDGGGTWNTAGAYWLNGGANVTWTDGNDASFGAGGTGDKVYLSGAHTVGNLGFTVSGYEIKSEGYTTTDYLTINGGNIDVASDKTATITSFMTGTGFTKTGAGKLTWKNGNQPSAALSINGTVSVSAGTLAAYTYRGNGDGGMFSASAATSTYAVASGAVLDATGRFTLGSKNKIVLNGGRLNVSYITGNENYLNTLTMASGSSVTGSTSWVRAGYDTNPTWTTTGTGASEAKIDTNIYLYKQTADTLTLNVDNNTNTGGNDLTITGNIADYAGQAGMTVVKAGDGMLTLAGANAYSGATAVNAGTLVVDGSQTGTGAISVAGGATLAGSGSINGAVTVADLGNVSAGGSAVGTLTINNSLSLGATSTLAFDLAAVGDSDKISMASSNLSINDFDLDNLSFITLAGFDAGDYVLVDANSISGLLGDNLSGVVGDRTASLASVSGDLVLTVGSVVPEPSTFAMLSAALLGLIAYAWRKRK